VHKLWWTENRKQAAFYKRFPRFEAICRVEFEKIMGKKTDSAEALNKVLPIKCFLSMLQGLKPCTCELLIDNPTCYGLFFFQSSNLITPCEVPNHLFPLESMLIALTL